MIRNSQIHTNILDYGSPGHDLLGRDRLQVALLRRDNPQREKDPYCTALEREGGTEIAETLRREIESGQVPPDSPGGALQKTSGLNNLEIRL
jgi:hypothetical protein